MGDDYVGCPYCGAESLAQEFMGGSCPFCGKANYELEGYMGGYRHPPNYASLRTAAMCETCGENVAQGYDDEMVHLDEDNEPDHETDYDHAPKPVYDQSDEWECAECGKTTIGKECHYCGGIESMDDRIDRAMENRKERSMRDRMSAIDFVASQNVTDREELLFRAHRHASDATCRLPVPVAQRVVQAFVAAVNQEIGKTAGCGCSEDQPCDDCGAEAGEKCRPYCTGEAAHQDEKADKKTKKSHRTAATHIQDFPDELMF